MLFSSRHYIIVEDTLVLNLLQRIWSKSHPVSGDADIGTNVCTNRPAQCHYPGRTEVDPISNYILSHCTYLP